MPIRDIQFQPRGGNALLQGILDGQRVSLSGALASAVQLTRDANNNQVVQERDVLDGQRFERTFAENRFRDRRDFSRRVQVQDRDFGERVRQFNAIDADRDASRALQAELGRGSLGLQRARLAIAQRDSNLRAREGEARLNEFSRRVEQDIEDRERGRALLDELNIVSDPDRFAANLPVNLRTGTDIEDLRTRRLGEIERELEFIGQSRLAGSVEEDLDRTILPPRTERGVEAERLINEAQNLEADGDFLGASELYAQAAASAPQGSPVAARAEQARANTVTRARAAAEQSGNPGAVAGIELYELIENNRSTSTRGAGSLREIHQRANSAVNEEAFVTEYLERAISALQSADGNTRPPSPTTEDTMRKELREIYQTARRVSSSDLNVAESSLGDPFGRYFQQQQSP